MGEENSLVEGLEELTEPSQVEENGLVQLSKPVVIVETTERPSPQQCVKTYTSNVELHKPEGATYFMLSEGILEQQDGDSKAYAIVFYGPREGNQ